MAEIDPEQARNKEVGEFNHILKDRRTELWSEIDPEQARNKEVGEFNHILKDRRTDLYSLTRTKKKVETALDREGVS